ncbi:MAG: hypothetical protein MRZ79_02310 [Bacteroidia bacterium]|nr:hypothetical protein [Bacteroidia bacterium]
MKNFGYLILGLMLCSLAACEVNKYESGPNVSVLTPRERVTNTWRWKLALNGGENQTGALKDSTIAFTKDQVVKICGPEGGCREGTWDLVRKNTKVNIIFGKSALAYDIELLKFNEMWLRAEDSITGGAIEWDLVPFSED